MEFKTYLKILWRRKWVVFVTPIVTVTIVAIGVFLMTPKYTATTTLRILLAQTNEVDTGEIDYTDRLLTTYSKIAQSGLVLSELQQQLNLNELPEVGFEFLSKTDLMNITATNEDPVLATQMANALAHILIDQNRRTKVGRNFIVTIIDPAVVPKKPSEPKVMLSIALGLVVGLVGGLGLAFLFENLDTTLYSVEQIETATDLVTMGQIPSAKKELYPVLLNAASIGGEAFRRLRTNVLSSTLRLPLQALLVTSAGPGEGKSTIVCNLAYSLAQCGRTVVVVDGDMRIPTQHAFFDLPNNIGLSNLLKQEATLDEAVQDTAVPGLKVVTSGPIPSNPAELLQSREMVTMIRQLLQQFDLVLLDSPALLAVTDAAVLASFADGVLLVIERARTRQEDVRAVRRQLDTVKAKPLGSIINRAEPDRYSHYHYRLDRSIENEILAENNLFQEIDEMSRNNKSNTSIELVKH